MTPHQLADALRSALGDLVRRGALRLRFELPPEVAVERPHDPANGDYSTNLALRLAARADLAPQAIAELLADELRSVDGIASVGTAAPGFVNVTVSPTSLGAVAAQVVAAGRSYGAAQEASEQLAVLLPPAADEAGVGLVGQVGADALRYALARRPSPATVELDVELLTRASVENPLYQVQYIHARLCALLRNGADLGVVLPVGEPAARAASALLVHPREGELLWALVDYPGAVHAALRRREPHRIARHLEHTAAMFHRFSDSFRLLPQGDEESTDLHAARLLLVEATRTVMANGLHLLGVAAPARM